MDARLPIGLLLIAAILVGGCTDTYGTKYQKGDIVSLDDEYKTVAHVILDYNKQTDQYLVTWIYRDGLGRWTRADADSAWEDREIAEYLYDTKIGHVDVNDLVMIRL